MSASNQESPFDRAWLTRMVGDKPPPQGQDIDIEVTEYMWVLKDHEVRTVVNEVRRLALEYGGSQQLRDRLASYLAPILKGQQRP